MSPEWAVAAQFEAYNEHDIDAFVACFSPDFKAYRMPSETSAMVGKEALREFYVNNRFNSSAKLPVPAWLLIGSHNVYYVKSPVVVNKFISHIHVAINQYVSNF
ncbi:nuclear transport factor 2 family protein [Pectobacterium peruviense]|uniref:nuclear transport factor 2 family protein n=1 Tax=Pectobacterium peruviense TaxID=2066479 RepID=UPI001CB9B0CB|nr:nuclear transport factor 2 family protein [Pectobacterium peruviense]